MSWRTNTYRELGRRLSDVVGGKTAAEFAKLGLATVDGDPLVDYRHVIMLMRLPN